MSKRDVVVLGIARSAIGTFGGSLADIEPAELAGTVMKEAVGRSGVDPQAINYVTVGTTMPTDSRYAYVSRVASIQAGLSMDSVAMQVSRLCASGLQGIVTTAQNIMLNDADYGIGGGVEVMSKAAYLLPALRSGARMGDTKAIDSMVAATGDQRSSVTTEIERYCVWPGQACGYMVGRQAINRMRDAARQTLQANFDIKGFHDTLLTK